MSGLPVPKEILQHILLHVGPEDLASLRRTCQSLKGVIDGNVLLFRAQYLYIADDPGVRTHRNPQDIEEDEELDWTKALKDLVRLQKILDSRSSGIAKQKEILFVEEKTLEFLSRSSTTGERKRTLGKADHALSTASHNTDLLNSLFSTWRHDDACAGNNIGLFMCRSSLFCEARKHTRREQRDKKNKRRLTEPSASSSRTSNASRRAQQYEEYYRNRNPSHRPHPGLDHHDHDSDDGIDDGDNTGDTMDTTCLSDGGSDIDTLDIVQDHAGVNEFKKMRQRQLSAKLHVHYGKPVLTYYTDPNHHLHSMPGSRSSMGLPSPSGMSRPLPLPATNPRWLTAPLPVALATGPLLYPRADVALLSQIRTYPFAATQVYTLANYDEASLWGPFKDDFSGRVDWERVEAVMMVLGYNIRKRGLQALPAFELWNHGFGGCFGGSYVGVGDAEGWERMGDVCRMPLGGTWGPEAEGGVKVGREGKWKVEKMVQEELERRDPYGVTGLWFRIVCFVDYSEFFLFNFPARSSLPGPYPGTDGLGNAGPTDHMDLFTTPPRTHDTTGAAVPPTPPRPHRELLDTEEVTRLIIMSLTVTDIQDPGEDDGQELPVVHFKGTSRWLDGTDITSKPEVKGSVRLTKDGDVRWTCVSMFNGEERWTSECVQIGGVRSGRGVIGNWIDSRHHPHGPVGPTAFSKVMGDTMEDATADSPSLLPLLRYQ